jgi:protein-tyrosine-phosphatase/DNA-binding transcriptional ArsR family regulator
MPSTAEPPVFVQLTGHPVRWQLLTELARSDRQVRELTTLLGHQQSLTSYHLGRLRAAGLVRARRSSGNGRGAYYSLDLAACGAQLAAAGASLHPGLELAPRPRVSTPRAGDRPATRVLFLCTGNSARSQLAEALLRGVAGPDVEVASAGSHPREVHRSALAALRRRGVDASGQQSTHLQDLVGQRFDWVISLCDRLRETCPDLPGGRHVAHWSIADPTAETAANARRAFERTADELSARIEFLLHTIEHERETGVIT